MAYTTRGQRAIEEAVSMATTLRNTVVEPEHLLRAIMKSKSLLNTVMSAEEMSELGNKLDRAIAGFPQLGGGAVPQPRMSPRLGTVSMAMESNKKGEFISVPQMIYDLFGDKTIASYTAKTQKIRQAAQAAADAPMNTLESDDPEDKMSQFAVEMVEQARNNKYDPVIGRDDEIRQVVEILAKKTKSNAMMVGRPGVGKTAIVNGIAQMIAKGECLPLEGCKIYNVDVGSMVAGSSLRGQFEERLKGVVKEAEDNPKVILFIDEIHIVLGAGEAGGSLDAANILKPGLASGALKIIGATTFDEYRKYVTKDAAFERRFTRVNVREPSVDDTVTIMRGLRERLEMHHGVKIADRALVYASQMGKRYIPNRRLPDVAIDLVDTACASTIISLNSEPANIVSLKQKIWSMELERTALEIDSRREDAQSESKEYLREALERVDEKLRIAREELLALQTAFDAEKGYLKEARELKQRLEDARNRIEQAQRENNRYLVYDLQTNIIPVYEQKLAECNQRMAVVDVAQIMEVVSRLSGVPVSKLNAKENEKLRSLEANIGREVFGQAHAVRLVADAIITAKAGLSDENKPIASFLFLGPTGVGKTELSKAISRELNGTVDNLVILDMSDYASEISLTKLIGAPAGYVGYDEGGRLTEPVKEMPYTVVLFDELNLAHSSVINVLYQLLDEGRVTDGKGVSVSFKDTVIVMTSNLGQEFIHDSHVEMDKLMAVVTERFGHPLVNRIDNIVPFHHLSVEALNAILSKELDLVNRRLVEKRVTFTVSDAVREHIINSVIGSGFGARIIKRFVKDNFTVVIARILIGQGSEPFSIRCFLQTEGIEGDNHGDYTFVCSR